mmetsp:Transcript_35809/g.64992  ORF Transcript_35809/g.64992 Transcript_35809/m.64992 type:complete len:438 (-) Transcript_35809:466-1779(-)|eukprot:CAMPEP_0197650476 /NCGR_PEP_ID=MMETSP1338-20131121/30967_1 /TAXON_ID=43686 ORGANISM="Pelagodinium beii, Strain RCC1491" /NCGR_SAMPLE_ID=MMETSP1338 /ASSEMBLY_ACC=CAM_ASM_000754 /LENGTH=437 /DNA_ID=CAMNT_0043224891 /DNA_START=39 /DNA_END=1352 /DNA_ORIENTATION=+
MVATVEDYGDPQNLGEEVKLMFELFDVDRSGKIDRSELKNVFQTLEGSWTEQRLEKLLDTFDQNGDGELNLTEFWSWVTHSLSKDFRPQLLDKAIEKDKAEGATQEARLAEWREKKAKQDAKENVIAQKLAEREAGKRMSREAFIKEKMDAGFTKEVAQELYQKADDDNDGDVDAQELGWLVGDNLATLDQVKGVYRKGIAGEDGAVTVADLGEGSHASLIETFMKWDEDGDGTVTPEELEKILRKVNPKFTAVSVEKMMKEIDANGDGFIDIHEFVDWLSGQNLKKKKMKKKAKEEQDSKLSLALHRKRSEEAKEMKLQAAFEEVLHLELERFCKSKKLKVLCGTLNAAGSQTCSKCGLHQTWICHGCGWVNGEDSCMNGCSSSSFGWSCIGDSKKCGFAKKKPDFWQRAGFAGDMDKLALDVDKMIEAAKEQPNS